MGFPNNEKVVNKTQENHKQSLKKQAHGLITFETNLISDLVRAFQKK